MLCIKRKERKYIETKPVLHLLTKCRLLSFLFDLEMMSRRHHLSDTGLE